MSVPDFSAALGGLINSARSQGVPVGNVVLALELTKADLIRQIQDVQRNQASKIIPAQRLPPGVRPNAS